MRARTRRVGRTLLESLKSAAAEEWRAYTQHPFVRALGDGSLPEPCFRRYLGQDYLFLIHFSRAYALAVLKSEQLDDMRQAAATLDALLNREVQLHVEFCAGWGLRESDLAALPEAAQTVAYTRFVLDRGQSGDLLDLLVALAPCVFGYGEIGLVLKAAGAAGPGNPYRLWIETYAGDDYQGVVAAAGGQLERVAARRLGAAAQDSPRWPMLVETFRAATRLEIDFWQMGLDADH